MIRVPFAGVFDARGVFEIGGFGAALFQFFQALAHAVQHGDLQHCRDAADTAAQFAVALDGHHAARRHADQRFAEFGVGEDFFFRARADP